MGQSTFRNRNGAPKPHTTCACRAISLTRAFIRKPEYQQLTQIAAIARFGTIDAFAAAR